MDEMEKFHADTFEYKKLLEDKAKTSLFSVTISITLIVSFVDLLFKIDYFRTLSIILLFFSVTNMILAGKMALDVSGNLNVFSQLFPSELHLKKKVKKEILAYAIEANVNYNTIRNNHVFLSYKSIMISLAAIALVGLLYIVGRSTTAALPDKQTEILNQLKADSIQNTKSLNDINNIFTKIDNNSVEITKTLKEMNVILNEMKKQIESLVNDKRKLSPEVVPIQK
ncbi:hypothetical protein ACAF76_008325 [Brevibacillus sp. TJ4]|uniref:hypothetical protein n=1 Tax=Brevibacillus sp. TJ4 TaxID=3234853 RepID=UPI0037CDB189